MRILRLLAVFALLGVVAVAAPLKVLIVADEFPAMEVLARQLKTRVGAESTIVAQNAIPADTAGYHALIVYIHKTITEPAEKTFIEYARKGGRLILVHHSISSGKRQNRYWFEFLGVTLPTGDFDKGGYKYFEDIGQDIVNLAPAEFISSNKVKYSGATQFQRPGESASVSRPSFHLEESEVYLNHVFNGPRTILLGLKYFEPKSGRTYQQDHAGWYRPADKGWVMYFMPGHSVHEFENETYAQILANAVSARLK